MTTTDLIVVLALFVSVAELTCLRGIKITMAEFLPFTAAVRGTVLFFVSREHDFALTKGTTESSFILVWDRLVYWAPVNTARCLGQLPSVDAFHQFTDRVLEECPTRGKIERLIGH